MERQKTKRQNPKVKGARLIGQDYLLIEGNEQLSTSDHQRTTINHQPPTTNEQPPTNNEQPSTTNHQRTTNHQPPTTNHQPPTTNEPTTCHLSSYIYHLFPNIYFCQLKFMSFSMSLLRLSITGHVMAARSKMVRCFSSTFNVSGK